MKVILLLIGSLSLVNSECPPIVSRDEWGARSASSSILPIRPAPFYIVHHTARDYCMTQEECVEEMKAIQTLHIDVNKWNDIGYNFFIGGDGFIYEGRGWNKQAADGADFSDKSHGIAFMGDYSTLAPPRNMTRSAKSLIQCGIDLGYAGRSYRLIGHSQVSATSCPGTALFDEIKYWDNFEPNPKPE